MTGDGPLAASGPYAEWQPALDRLAGVTGVVLLAGGTDTGKTTFTRLLANSAAQLGRQVSVVDGDLGQSEIGPPTCVSLADCIQPGEALSDASPSVVRFVGTTSPASVPLDYAVAVKRAVDTSTGELTIVDIGGYISGAGARHLFRELCSLIRPASVAAFQRASEAEPMVGAGAADCGEVVRLTVPACIARRPPVYRAQRRAARFGSYFAGAQEAVFHFDEVRLENTWLGSGVSLPAHLLRFASQTLASEARVFYAETAGSHLRLMVNRPLRDDSPLLGLVQAQLRAESVTVSLAPRLKHLIVGLEAERGGLLGLGLIEAIDFRRRTVGVLTPVRAPGAAKVVRLGLHRIQPDGREIGTLRAGEME